MLSFAATVEQLSSGAPTVVPLAINAVSRLPRARVCGDSKALSRRPRLPPQRREAYLEHRRALAEVDALLYAGRLEAGLTRAVEVLALAEELAWPPAIAASRLRVGRVTMERGDYERARAALEQTYLEASRLSLIELAIDAALDLTSVTGDRQSQPELGLHWADLAELGLHQLGDDSDHGRAALLHYNRGLVLGRASEYERAVEILKIAVNDYMEAFGPEHPGTSEVLSAVGGAHGLVGDFDAAAEAYTSALEIAVRTFGEEHPNVAQITHNFATAVAQSGDLERAVEIYRRALRLRERTLPPEHPDIGATLFSLGGALFLKGERSEAVALFNRALAIMEQALGPDDPALAEVLNNIGFAQDANGEHARARETLTRALELNRRAFGDEHSQVALNLTNLASANAHLGDHARALELLREALPIFESVLPAGHDLIAKCLRRVAIAEFNTGAIESGQRTLARAATASTEAELAEIRFAHARARWDRGGAKDRRAARVIAERARDSLGEDEAELRAELTTWLEEHPER